MGFDVFIKSEQIWLSNLSLESGLGGIDSFNDKALIDSFNDNLNYSYLVWVIVLPFFFLVLM